MYLQNLERNRVIYELWENGFTVDQIASRTSILRSTVGYYVRKFNRLAAEGKPVVLLRQRKVAHKSFFSEILQLVNEDAVGKIRLNAIKMFQQGQYEQLYYMLMDLKLIRDLDRIIAPDVFDGALK